MFDSPKISLASLLGKEYARALADAAAFTGAASKRKAERLVNKKVSLYSRQRQYSDIKLLEKVGSSVIPQFVAHQGAATDAFAKALHREMSPLSARGMTRVGEDGRLYYIGKSEHYHASLGHSFPGYELLNVARQLGVPNATHNNTRGYITRTLERELVRAANGGVDDEELGKILISRERKVLNRVVNLETGSLAVEAAVKMMLARFYRLDSNFDAPVHEGKTPVFLTMEDYGGGKGANYHGTTVLTQTMRGLWPGFLAKAEVAGLYKVVTVKINDIADFKQKIEQYCTGGYYVAGFMHEIILMNYGAVELQDAYLKEAYALCEKHKVPTLVDEIQSCMWYPGMFCFRQKKLSPDFVVIGKGFPGGEYPASRLITTAEYDNLNLFGALVTNGQEELASLSYLITMEFAKANEKKIKKNGEYFQNELKKLVAASNGVIKEACGSGYLAGLRFADVDDAARYAKYLNGICIDISAQLYKADCPPVVLLKPPLTAGKEATDFLVGKLNEALQKYKITENE